MSEQPKRANKRMHYHKQYFHVCGVTLIAFCSLLLAGCGDDADRFFSGRPSEMAMVHNNVISGGPEAMLDLLKVPSRFPGTNASNIYNWQHSIVAWWMNKDKHETMKDMFKKLSQEEFHHLRVWVNVRHTLVTDNENSTLNEIGQYLRKNEGQSTVFSNIRNN